MGKTGRNLTLFLLLFILIGWTQEERNVKQHYGSSYGVPCDDTCDTREKDYYWCNTKKGWDYCSLKEGMDYKAQPCREDHPCGTYGKSYRWCYTEGGTWGYCGLLRNTAEPKALLYKSSNHMSVCWDECLYSEKKGYFWCHTDEGWDYCSPLPDVTYKNEPCRLDHYCGTHDAAYSWCYTNSGYDKCGVISSGECRHVVPDPAKVDSKTVISCTWDDNKSQKEIKFNAETDLAVSAEGSAWKNEIFNLIARWKNAYLNPEPGFKLITSDNLRFGVEKLTNAEGQQYYHLHIMVNVQAQTGRSTNLALVVIPQNEELPDRFIRLAFAESFRHRARISVEMNGFESDNNYSNFSFENKISAYP